MNKRGSGHVDVILGFIIFILAILLAVYYFKPISSERIEESSLNYLIDKVYKNISTILEEYPVSIIKSNLPGSQIISFDLSRSIRNNENLAVKDEDGNFLDYDANPDKINVDWKGSDFILFDISEDLKDSSKNLDSVKINESYYRIGLARTEKIISEKRVLELNRSYHLSYLEIKKYFNLPGNINFGFSLDLSDGNKIESFIFRNERGEVFSQRQSIDMLNASGYKKQGELIVEIW